MTMQRWVPTDRLEMLERRIARLGRRSERLGKDPLRLVDTGERRVVGGGALALVELHGDLPHLAGWEAVAEIRHGERRNSVHRLAVGVNADRWLRAPAACDHCGLQRRRAVTYVLRHESGKLAQVGSSCLADFTGTSDPLSRIGAASAVAAAAAVEPGADGPEAEASARFVELREFMAHVVKLAEEHGFVSRATAERHGLRATYALAVEAMDAPRAVPPWARDRAREIERWVLQELRGVAGDGFRQRVASFETGVTLRRDDAALAAAAYPLWRRARQQAEHVGEPGERVELSVEVRDVRRTERASRFGPVFWHQLRDDEGRELAWFAVGTRLTKGARVRIAGRVRRHDEFRGRAVTVLERCRIRDRIRGQGPKPRDQPLTLTAKRQSTP